MKEHPNPSLKKKQESTETPVAIKKYANRRLYNTATSSYVTLEDLAEMVKAGREFVVLDAKTSEDLTRSVLTQIIFEEENKGTHLLPISFLRQLIRFYGDSLQAFVPNYLEFSLESLRQEQERFRKQVVDSFATEPLRAVEEQARANITLFQQAMQLFNPFAVLGKGQEPLTPEKSEKSNETERLKEEISNLKQQIQDLSTPKT